MGYWRYGCASASDSSCFTQGTIVKSVAGLDLAALLEQIEQEVKQAPLAKQWAMNHCLAEVGNHHPAHRKRAIDIGKRLEVSIDYPVPPGCTPPYVPVWIDEVVRCREGVKGKGKGRA